MTTVSPDDPVDWPDGGTSEYPGTVDKAQRNTNNLLVSTTAFANAVSKAFAQAITGGRQFDDVLKQLALRLSSLAVANAFKPLIKSTAGGVGKIISDLFDGLGDPALTAQMGAIKPFAAGGVIGAPTYFPLSSGGLGLAGEAGPEAIMPLTRGANGALGVAVSGSAGANISVHIVTPDAASFRRSEAYVTGQIARAVVRGQRGM